MSREHRAQSRTEHLSSLSVFINALYGKPLFLVAVGPGIAIIIYQMGPGYTKFVCVSLWGKLFTYFSPSGYQ